MAWINHNLDAIKHQLKNKDNPFDTDELVQLLFAAFELIEEHQYRTDALLEKTEGLRKQIEGLEASIEYLYKHTD